MTAAKPARDPAAGGDPATAALAVANLGLVRPPVVYLLAIAIGLLLGAAYPLPFGPPALAAPLGGGLTLAALGLFASAAGALRRAGTPIPGNRPTTAIVRTGPYRFSRNPIYLAFSLLQLGIAIGANDPWVLATLAGALGLMVGVVVPREERYLAQRFGAEYAAYRAGVRRWL